MEEMDFAEMCMIFKSFQHYKSLQKKQTLLDWLWMHAKPNESDLQNIPYYLSGYRVCSTAYRSVLGLSAAAVTETFRNFVAGVMTLKGPKRRNVTHKRLMAETWMEAFFTRVGDKMPDTGALHLPSFLDKSIMYGYMKADMEEDGEEVIHYSTFCQLLRDLFPQVKIPKVNRFTRCDYCTILGEEKRRARDRDVRKYLDQLFEFHNDLQMRERKLYYHHRDKAKKYSRDFACIAQDGMDQAKLLLPRLVVTARAYASARKLRTHLTGVLNHGRQPKGYFDLFQFPHDANLTINILLFELESMGDDLPDILYLQMDNCWRENKNQFVLNFLAILVKLDIFVKEDAEINPDVIPNYVVPSTEKIELQKLTTDIEKYYRSRLFVEQDKTEWSSLLAPENPRWKPPERTDTWPLQKIIANKEKIREKQRLPEFGGNGLGFLGQRPEGVPLEIDDMIRNQVAPVREVYSGAYRRQPPEVTEVDNFEGVLPGSIVAVNLAGNYKPPHLAKVLEVAEIFFNVQWLKGSYKGKWVPWRGRSFSQIPKESVIYFDFQLDENDKLTKEAAQYLRRRYKELGNK